MKKIFLVLSLVTIINISFAQKIFAFAPLKGLGAWYGKSNFKNMLMDVNLSWFYAWGINGNFLNNIENPTGIRNIPQFSAGLFNTTNNDLDNLVKGVVLNPLDPTHPRQGLYWLIGNEPDMGNNTASDGYYSIPTPTPKLNDNIDAAFLALQYSRAFNLIKKYDHQAKIIFGGMGRLAEHQTASISMAERLMSEWQKIYGHPLKNDITGWHIHYYGCCNWALAMNPPEERDFELSINIWKDWQNTNFPGTETWLTEYGIRNSTPPPKIENGSFTEEESHLRFMEATTNFILNNQNTAYRIDRYAWFPFRSDWQYPAQLFNISDTAETITVFGQKYASLGNSPFKQLQTANRLFWYGSYPKDPTSLPLSNCKTISQNTRSLWHTLVRNFSPFSQILMTLETYYLSCLP